MRRILLEITVGLAVLVLLGSFHSQIARLKIKENDVIELKTLVRDAVANISSKTELDGVRAKAVAALESKLLGLEEKVRRANFGAAEAARIQKEIGETRREAALFREQVSKDISRTQKAVDGVLEEIRTTKTSNHRDIERTRQDLELLAGHIRPDSDTLSKELLAPAVQLNGDDTVGSGTLIYSRKNPKTNKVESYVITSYHVIRNILADTPRAKREGIAVTVYEDDEENEVYGDMVAHDKRIDAALLQLRSDRVFKNIARVISEEGAKKIRVWDPVYAVGCPLGNDPIPSQGKISSLHNELNGANYWMINAPTYFGNSGGGVYMSSTREFAGVFSKIYTHGRGNPVVIPHMGLFTPMPLIYRWLAKNKLAFVLSNASLPDRLVDPRLEQLLAPSPPR